MVDIGNVLPFHSSPEPSHHEVEAGFDALGFVLVAKHSDGRGQREAENVDVPQPDEPSWQATVFDHLVYGAV